MRMPPTDIIAEFWKRVMPEPNSGCWLWTGAYAGAGYGLFNLGKRRQRELAHRYSYVMARGAIPDGLEIDHKCRNRACCNPDHLEAVTHRVNVLRGIAPAAVHAKKTHCPNGHEYNEANTFLRVARNQRECRVCHRDRERERKRKCR